MVAGAAIVQELYIDEGATQEEVVAVYGAFARAGFPATVRRGLSEGQPGEWGVVFSATVPLGVFFACFPTDESGDPSAAVKTWAQGIFAARRRPRRSRGVILIHSCPIIYLDSDLPEAGLGVARRGRLRSPRPLPVGCRQEPVEGASDYPPRVEVAEPLLPPSWSASSLDRLMAEGFLAPAMAT